MKKLLLILLVGMFMISFSSAVLSDNIVSYWKLDESSGVVIDSAGSNNATNTGAVANEPGIISTAYNFTPDDYIRTDSNMTTLDNLTLSLWVNADEWGNDDIYSMGYNSANTFILINQVVGGFGYRFGGTFYTSIEDTPSANAWHHIVITRGDTNATFYLDGVAVDSRTVVNTQQPAARHDWGFAVTRNNTGSGFNGSIDEIGVWNRSLSPSEITELYNSGVGISFPFPTNEISVTLNSPDDGERLSGNITFNSTLTPLTGFNLTNATLFIWDSDGNIFLRDTNIVLGNSSNTTIFVVTNLTLDNYEWNVFGSSENSSGFGSTNFSASNNTFIWIPFIVDNEEFNVRVFETSRQEFLLNITTLPSVLSVNAILNYDGSRFTADTSCTGGVCEIGTAIDIPLVNIGESENKTFLWEISVFNGTDSLFINLSSTKQNVTRLHLEKCDGTFTIQTLNFTSFDEETQQTINPFMLDATFLFWLGTGTIKRNNTISETSISSLQLCISPSNETFKLDGTVEYNDANSTNYTNRNYFFQTDQINNISQDIRLGLLLSEDSTTFILKVQDRDILPVANVLIFTERFYPGEGIFKVVQVSQTDDNGRTVGFFETETVEYRFVLKQNSTTVLTTNKQKIVGESVPFTLTFTIGDDEGAAWEPFEPIDDLDSDINFNKTSNIVSFTYLDTSANFELARLIVEKVNASGLQNNVICSETSTQSSATITCNVTGNSTGQYIMRGIITRSGTAQLVEQESFAIEDFSTISGRLGLFLGWFIILIAVFAFKFNEVAGIILINLSIIFVNLIGIISFGYVFISAMVAISIIILVVLER